MHFKRNTVGITVEKEVRRNRIGSRIVDHGLKPTKVYTIVHFLERRQSVLAYLVLYIMSYYGGGNNYG